jgi:hypothetical protein
MDVGKNSSTRAKWRSSSSARRSVQKKCLTEPTLLEMAGFQVITIGRFWVIAEVVSAVLNTALLVLFGHVLDSIKRWEEK